MVVLIFQHALDRKRSFLLLQNIKLRITGFEGHKTNIGRPLPTKSSPRWVTYNWKNGAEFLGELLTLSSPGYLARLQANLSASVLTFTNQSFPPELS